MAIWADMGPQFSWRPSQAHLLEVASHVTDRRWHLYAGQPRATELVLAAARERPDPIGRRLGWRPSPSPRPTTA